jgi:hypothetical protein
MFLRQAGLRYHEKVIGPGAQTERQGDAGPVRVAWSRTRTGRLLLINLRYQTLALPGL